MISFFLKVVVEPKQSDRSRIVQSAAMKEIENIRKEARSCTDSIVDIFVHHSMDRIEQAMARSWVQHYQPKRVTDNARELAMQARMYAPPEPLKGPLGLKLEFRFPWLKGDSKKTRALVTVPKHVKPDHENLVKQMCDVLEACGFFKNDSQIAESHVTKIKCDEPGVHVELWEME